MHDVIHTLFHASLLYSRHLMHFLKLLFFLSLPLSLFFPPLEIDAKCFIKNQYSSPCSACSRPFSYGLAILPARISPCPSRQTLFFICTFFKKQLKCCLFFFSSSSPPPVSLSPSFLWYSLPHPPFPLNLCGCVHTAGEYGCQSHSEQWIWFNMIMKAKDEALRKATGFWERVQSVCDVWRRFFN